MNVSKHLQGSFRLFETAVFVKRFDVLDSPTGIFTDLTWNLSERYVLPRISSLSETDHEVDLKAAWHEKGLFFQSEFPMDTARSSLLGGTPKLAISLLVNCRHAPGIQRANANCTRLVCPLERTNRSLTQTNANFYWTKINRAKDSSPEYIDKTFAPAQLEWMEDDRCMLKFFIGSQCLPSYNPIEFNEISFDVNFDHRYHQPFRFVNTYHSTGTIENPSSWCVAKLVDK